MKQRKTTIVIPDKLVDGWEKAEKAIDENATMLSERTYSLATGGLALSFTVVSFIIGENQISLDWQAPVIWSFFLVCIIADTLSIVYAKNRAERLESSFRDKKEKGITMTAKEVNEVIDSVNKKIRIVNTAVFIFLLATIIWAAAYCYHLLTNL